MAGRKRYISALLWETTAKQQNIFSRWRCVVEQEEVTPDAHDSRAYQAQCPQPIRGGACEAKHQPCQSHARLPLMSAIDKGSFA